MKVLEAKVVAKLDLYLPVRPALDRCDLYRGTRDFKEVSHSRTCFVISDNYIQPAVGDVASLRSR